MRPKGEGLQTLERMARATGGIERVNLGSIWSDLPRMPRMVSLAPWLLLAAMTLLLIEVLQRRTGLLSLRRPTFRRQAAEPAPTLAPLSAASSAKRVKRAKSPVPRPGTSKAPTPSPAPPPPAPGRCPKTPWPTP